jgi:NDP-sugar pyrophosphorylase family protein
MHLIIDQLRCAGIRRVNVTTHYQPEKITDYFGDGAHFGVDLNYVTEDSPLGTAGALSLIVASDEPLLVMNGDILARVDFRAMLEHHREHRADMTVAVRQHEVQMPYGVIEPDGTHVRCVREKPVLKFLVNAGIYILEPAVVRHIPNGHRFEMTHLIQQLLEHERSVVMFPIAGYWLDIGKMGDYVQAQEDVKSGRFAT